MIRVLLNGCNGKMGRVISNLAKASKSLQITAGVDRNAESNDFPVYSNIFDCKEEIDVILDFSRPDSLENLINYSKDKKIPLILCTTGYSEDQIKKIIVMSEFTPIFRSANMSLGVNLLNNILKQISALLYKDFDIEIIEKHHNQKVDAPSGTALLLANTIKASIPEDTNFVYGREGLSKREHKDIGIHAVRGGSIVGDHDVIFAGQGEIIELKHIAMSREVFAIGALKACEFMFEKPAGLYSMDNIINSQIN